MKKNRKNLQEKCQKIAKNRQNGKKFKNRKKSKKLLNIIEKKLFKKTSRNNRKMVFKKNIQKSRIVKNRFIIKQKTQEMFINKH